MLLDLHLPGTNGLEVLRRLGSLSLNTRTVLLTASIERGQMRTALVRGAWGVLFKDTATDLLTKCIRQVSRGEYWVGRDSVAQVWNVETGERRFALHGHEHPLRCVASNADGSLIATAGEETRVMVWDGTTGKLRYVLHGHTDFVNAASMSADGRWLATGDADARVLVWDLAAGKLQRTLLGHADELAALAFSADGKLLASAGLDGKVLLWDMTTGLQRQALTGTGAPVASLAFNRTGSLLAGGSADGRVLAWNTDAFGVAPRELAVPGSGVNSVAFDAKNPNRLFAGDQDGRVTAWIVPPSAVGL